MKRRLAVWSLGALLAAAAGINNMDELSQLDMQGVAGAMSPANTPAMQAAIAQRVAVRSKIRRSSSSSSGVTA